MQVRIYEHLFLSEVTFHSPYSFFNCLSIILEIFVDTLNCKQSSVKFLKTLKILHFTVIYE